jgi:anti-sigma-D factor RsdA-like protein
VADLHDREATGVDQDPLDSADAIDFSLVHADDAFLDALGAAQPDQDGTFADDKLAALLLSWRHDVDAEPIHELVDPKLAVATVQAARIRQRRGSRLLAPIAAAAAVLAIVFAGVGLAARDAQPGDTLWGLTRVLYADHARSVEAANAVRADLHEAEAALANGRVAEAKSMLDQARHQLPTVSTEDGKADLQAQHAALVAKLPDNPAVGSSPPPAALPTTAPGGSGTTGPVTTTPPDPTTTDPTTTDPKPTTTDPKPTTTESGSGRSETSPNNVPNSPNTPNTQPAGGPENSPAVSPADKTAEGQP